MKWRQRTLKKILSCTGMGLHSGRVVRLQIEPAAENYGIRFLRSDVPGAGPIKSIAENVVATEMATSLGSGSLRIATVEHLLATLYGVGIDNALIKVDGPEIPIMDGSAAPFVFLLREAGIAQQSQSKRFLRIKREVTVRERERAVRFLPGRGFSISYQIDFKHPLIPLQKYELDFSDVRFFREICRARTFGFLRDVEILKKRGLALGGNLDNAIVLDDYHVLNHSGLRYHDEFVRHKILDALGDLALTGYSLIGRFEAFKSGHQLNHRGVARLLEDPGNYEVFEADDADSRPELIQALPQWELAEGVM